MIKIGDRYRHYKGTVYTILGVGYIVINDEETTVQGLELLPVATNKAIYENTMEEMTVRIVYSKPAGTYILAEFNEHKEEHYNLLLGEVVVYHNEELDQTWVRTVADFDSLISGEGIPLGAKRFTKLD